MSFCFLMALDLSVELFTQGISFSPARRGILDLGIRGRNLQTFDLWYGFQLRGNNIHRRLG